VSASRRRLPALLVTVALGAAGCTADEAAVNRAGLGLLALFLYGLLVFVLQSASVLAVLPRPRPQGAIAYGVTTFLAAVAAAGGILAFVTATDLPARLRPRVGRSLLMVLGEVVLIVGAWFAVTFVRYGYRQAPPAEEGTTTAGAVPAVRALVVAGAALFLAVLIAGYWLCIHGGPTAAHHP
jgi:hypothetical protein